MEYEVRQIDAWAYSEGGWTWNNSFRLFNFKTNAQDHKAAFLRALKDKVALRLKRNTYYVDYDGSVYELRLKKTDEPLFAALPVEI